MGPRFCEGAVRFGLHVRNLTFYILRTGAPKAQKDTVSYCTICTIYIERERERNFFIVYIYYAVVRK